MTKREELLITTFEQIIEILQDIIEDRRTSVEYRMACLEIAQNSVVELKKEFSL